MNKIILFFSGFAIGFVLAICIVLFENISLSSWETKKLDAERNIKSIQRCTEVGGEGSCDETSCECDFLKTSNEKTE